MIRTQDIPALLYFCFMIAYFATGDPKNETWSVFYFCSNYIFILWLIFVKPPAMLRYTSISLALSLLVFSVLKYIYPEIERKLVFGLFLISIILNICLQVKSKK